MKFINLLELALWLHVDCILLDDFMLDLTNFSQTSGNLNSHRLASCHGIKNETTNQKR